ncbi:hypothetical protein D3C86_1336940 [compost metagenome]
MNHPGARQDVVEDSGEEDQEGDQGRDRALSALESRPHDGRHDEDGRRHGEVVEGVQGPGVEAERSEHHDRAGEQGGPEGGAGHPPGHLLGEEGAQEAHEGG